MAGFLSCIFPTHSSKTPPGMTGNGNQANGPSGSSVPDSLEGGIKYEVFLSFRGKDTRNGFTSLLYHELRQARVDVYRDNEEIRPSAGVHASLLEAIENSTMAVPIFSKNYASSKSCLLELGKIYECRNRVRKIIILPIFYDIEPSVVKYQTGPFKKSFVRHRKRRVSSQVLDDWKKALEGIAKLKGHTVRGNEDQAEVIKTIVSDIKKLLRSGEVSAPEHLVGMDQREQEVVEKLQASSRDVRIIEISGMSGIGKTTLAKAVYDKIRPRYNYFAFISDIDRRSQGKLFCTLQNQLISDLLNREYVGLSPDENTEFIRRRFSGVPVLIVLDDVECLKQVKEFAVDLDPPCFGLGSMIIVTTTTSTLIKDALKHKMQPLDEADSLKLFCRHAFGTDIPLGGYDKLSQDIAQHTGGIPSIIEIVGRTLYGDTNKDSWEETLQKLKKSQHLDMQSLLDSCYEKYLDDFQKQIFLDTTCFLVGKSKTVAHYMWHACELYPNQGVNKLLQLSLLKIGDKDEFVMRYPVIDFGRKIVEKENPQPALRSRLWNHDEAIKVLREKKGTEKIEALCLKFENSFTESLTNESFRSLPELRFLSLDKAKISGDFQNLFPKLRWLDLTDSCDISEELKNLSLEKLVILDISRSNIKKDWQGWKSIMEKAEDLKVIVLASCRELQGSPTFTDGMRLERLSFENCGKLRRVNTVSNALESLVYLNLKGCTEVNELPNGSLKALRELIIDGTSITQLNAETHEMKNLETLSASGCKKLATIDDSIKILKYLSCLVLDDTAIKCLPVSIGSLTKLQNLSLGKCKELHALPESIGNLSLLTRMDLSGTAIKELPVSVEHLECLKVLLMGSTHIEKFPESITKLKRLQELDFSLCRKMRGRIPDGITNLSSLTTLLLSATAISSLPQNISGLSCLRVLNLWECEDLEDLPRLPTTLTTLHVGSRALNRIPELSNVKELVELHLADNTGQSPNDGISELWPPDSFQWIPHLPKLETLVLHISKTTELPNLSFLYKLRKLFLSCPLLQSLPKLPPNLTNLHLKCCGSITQYENLLVLTILSELEVDQCGGESINLENLRELRRLKIDDGLKELCGIEELHHLRELTAPNCLIQGRLSELRERGTNVKVI